MSLTILPVFRRFFLAECTSWFRPFYDSFKSCFTHNDLMIISIFFLFQWSLFIQSSQKCMKQFFKILEPTNFSFKTFSNSFLVVTSCYKTCSIYIFFYLYKMSSILQTKLWWSEMSVSTVDEWKKRSRFVSIEIIDPYGVWAFKTFWVFNEMVQFDHTTQMVHFVVRKWHINIP